MRAFKTACVAVAILNVAFWATYGVLLLLTAVGTVFQGISP